MHATIDPSRPAPHSVVVAPVPTFGHAMLAHWGLAPDILYLNHGTAGVTPRVVLEFQQALQREIERHPARFLFRELMRLAPGEPGGAGPVPRLRAAAAEVAAFLGARDNELVFVDNATAGVNAVLRSMPLSDGDEIVLLDQAYGAVAKTAQFVARVAGARVVTVALPFPVEGDVTEAYAEAVEQALTPRTRIAVLDLVSSETALTLPVRAMADRCRRHGVPVLVDGAHAPGAIAVDVTTLGAAWFVGNLHKWAFAPRGCGVLWAAPGRAGAAAFELHPPVVSWGLDNGFTQEFDWTGTRDPSPMLSAPAGLAFMRDTLGVEAMRRWNHDLAWRAAHELAGRWGVRFAVPEAMVGCMASVLLPERVRARGEGVSPRLKDWLMVEHGIEAQVLDVHGVPHVRLAAQVYNEERDYDTLARAIEGWTG
jgi:isopenicillin-N epimerase